MLRLNSAYFITGSCWSSFLGPINGRKILRHGNLFQIGRPVTIPGSFLGSLDTRRRCHVMLAHISTERSAIAKSGLKAWDEEWRIVEPYLDRTIAEFLSSLPARQKEICNSWLRLWQANCEPWTNGIAELACHLNRTEQR